MNNSHSRVWTAKPRDILITSLALGKWLMKTRIYAVAYANEFIIWIELGVMSVLTPCTLGKFNYSLLAMEELLISL